MGFRLPVRGSDDAGRDARAWLRTKRADLIAEWQRAAAAMAEMRGLSEPALRDHVPQILDAAIDAADDGTTTASAQAGEAHGRRRIAQGIELEQALEELELLRACLVRRLEGAHARFAPAQVEAIHRALDRAVRGSARAYGRAIEEQRRADEARERFLSEASALLSKSLELRPTLQSLAELAVPHVADWCVIDLAGPDGSIERVAVHHVDPAKVDLAHELRLRYPPDPSAATGVAAVLRTGQSVLVPRVSDEVLVATAVDEEHLAILRSLGLSSYMLVPIRASGRVLGSLGLVAEAGRTYGERDLALAQQLADRAGLAIDNAHLHEEVRRAVKVREDVLAIVSHDLRTPLSLVSMGASLLRHACVGGTAPRHLDIIQRGVVRMQRLIEDLLDMANIRSGRLAITATPLRVEDLLDDVRNALGPLASENGVFLDVRSAEAASVTVRADRDRIQQVFANLVGNAVKVSGPGKRITVAATRAGGEARFEVRDEGPGIEPALQADVFEPYVSMARSGAQRSTGLGLFIARGIITGHGGRIGVESQPGAGSTFWFTLPLAADGQTETG